MTPHIWAGDMIYGAYFSFAIGRARRNRNGTPSTSILSYTTALSPQRIYSFVLPITNPITHVSSCHWRRWSVFNHIKSFSSFKCLSRIGQELRQLLGEGRNCGPDRRPRDLSKHRLLPPHTPAPIWGQHISSVRGRSLQVMYETHGNWCVVFFCTHGSIFKYLVDAGALLRRSWRCKITPGSWDGSLHSIWNPSLHSSWSGSQYSQTSPGTLRKGGNGENCWQIDNQLKARRSKSHMSPRSRR